MDIIKNGQTGVLVQGREPAEFAEAIRWVLKSPDEAHAMALRGKSSIYPEFDISRLVADISALYV